MPAQPRRPEERNPQRRRLKTPAPGSAKRPDPEETPHPEDLSCHDFGACRDDRNACPRQGPLGDHGRLFPRMADAVRCRKAPIDWPSAQERKPRPHGDPRATATKRCGRETRCAVWANQFVKRVLQPPPGCAARSRSRRSLARPMPAFNIMMIPRKSLVSGWIHKRSANAISKHRCGRSGIERSFRLRLTRYPAAECHSQFVGKLGKETLFRRPEHVFDHAVDVLPRAPDVRDHARARR